MIEAGQNIRAIRELKNFTQNYVASRLHMSTPSYSNIETGKTEVTLSRLQQIAAVLQIDYQQILSLNRAQLLLGGNRHEGNCAQGGEGSCCGELIRQLQVKDEQIRRLLDILQGTGS